LPCGPRSDDVLGAEARRRWHDAGCRVGAMQPEACECRCGVARGGVLRAEARGCRHDAGCKRWAQGWHGFISQPMLLAARSLQPARLNTSTLRQTVQYGAPWSLGRKGLAFEFPRLLGQELCASLWRRGEHVRKGGRVHLAAMVVTQVVWHELQAHLCSMLCITCSRKCSRTAPAAPLKAGKGYTQRAKPADARAARLEQQEADNYALNTKQGAGGHRLDASWDTHTHTSSVA